MALAEGQSAERLRIRGHVQGVWFRGWAVDQATRLGLSGWVRKPEEWRTIVAAVVRATNKHFDRDGSHYFLPPRLRLQSHLRSQLWARKKVVAR